MMRALERCSKQELINIIERISLTASSKLTSNPVTPREKLAVLFDQMLPETVERGLKIVEIPQVYGLPFENRLTHKAALADALIKRGMKRKQIRRGRSTTWVWI